MTTQKGHLVLIPTTLGNNHQLDVLPQTVKRYIEDIDIYIVENEKTARRFIKSVCPGKPQPSLQLFALNKRTDLSELPSFLEPCLQGKTVGLLSEAGCPAIADPGAGVVKLAHEKNIRVLPLVGPSSILLAMMASGMNGQGFAFNGYLPIDKNERKNALKKLEKLSATTNQSQIFIETPYRNNKLLEDICSALHPDTLVCVACDITLETEFIKTLSVSQWPKNKTDLHKRPAIFIVHKF